MCRIMEEIWEEGRKEGREEGAIKIARDLLELEKIPPEKVAQLTLLPLEKVLMLC